MLGQTLETVLNTHEGKSGFLLIADNAEAFISRLTLCELAEHTLDIQYYIYHDDASGQLLRYKIIEAADRGVRVRILLDDVDMGGRDNSFKIFNAHPNITIRVFNPLVSREHFRNLEFIISMNRAGRRMHNKTFIVDDMIAITGGRNIGDEYFDARHQTNYVDLDLLTIGPVVKDVVTSFRDYWLSYWSVAIDDLSRMQIARKHVTSMRKRLKDRWSQSKNMKYFQALYNSDFANRLINDDMEYTWASAQLFYDKPEKLLTEKPGLTTHIGPSVSSIIANTQESLYISSPYFVPGKSGVVMMSDFNAKGVSVNIITNSLASTDVTAAHSGYRRYRESLLKGGVELYEYKPTAKGRSLLSRFRKGKQRSSLHAKYVVSDEQYLFIGSSNIDPRSENLNTEIGMVINSEKLATEVIALFDNAKHPENSYRLSMNGEKSLRWVTTEAGKDKVYDSEPEASIWKKTLLFLISLLPVERLL